MAIEEGWVGTAEVAAHLQVTQVSMYCWVDAKSFPVRRVGRLLRFRPSEVDEGVKAREDDSASSSPGQTSKTRPTRMAENRESRMMHSPTGAGGHLQIGATP